MKFATVTAVLLMIIVCVLLPKLPAIHTWAVEREEERIAEAKLPAGVKGSDITISNDYVTQTVRIELPQTEVSYFENDPLTGSSNHIDNLSYAVSKGSSGLIEITMDQVYELDMDYDENYYYFAFLTPHEVYDKDLRLGRAEHLCILHGGILHVFHHLLEVHAHLHAALGRFARVGGSLGGLLCH